MARFNSLDKMFCNRLLLSGRVPGGIVYQELFEIGVCNENINPSFDPYLIKSENADKIVEIAHKLNEQK